MPRYQITHLKLEVFCQCLHRFDVFCVLVRRFTYGFVDRQGYGFVVMKTQESYNTIINKPGHVLEGSHLSVSERKGANGE